ncbi:MAG: hypothetical protein AAGC55_24950 [Myxococcota bacterium]
MIITWLTPQVIRATRTALLSHHPDWSVHFVPDFLSPPAPADVPLKHWHGRWPAIAEHVARAERVSQVVREQGLDVALSRFRGSGHAVELATLIAAAVQAERLEFDLLDELLSCKIDEFVAYSSFLDLLNRFRDDQTESALAVYERFCAGVQQISSTLPTWRERVDAVRDGLAGFYVMCGRPEDGHRLYLERHREDPRGTLAAIAASRVFWTAGEFGRAIVWLDMGAERADELGRGDLAGRLRKKRDVLRSRQS